MDETSDKRASELCEIVVLVNGKGLHARAAAKFVQVAAMFKAEIFVAKDEARVTGDSIMGLMMLAAPCGTRLKLCSCGPEAAEAIAALSNLIARGFDEE